MVDEDPDFEGVWSCGELLEYEVAPANSNDRINNNNAPVSNHFPFPCPSPVPNINSPAMVVANKACEEPAEGPDAWNDCPAAVACGEDVVSQLSQLTHQAWEYVSVILPSYCIFPIITYTTKGC
jgi:hypothetical protein